MKIGILNAISPETSKVNWGGSPVEAYIRFFQSAGLSADYTGYNVALDQFPESPEACDAYIITGSMQGVYDDDPWIARLAQFIRDCYQANKKLIGICFGHQIIAHALGGRAEKSEKGWGLGLDTFAITQEKAWMTGGGKQCSLFFAHQDQVINLPPEAEALGGNAFCPNAFYAIDGRVLGIQGHPEFTTAIMTDLLSKMETRVDGQRHAAAVTSLNNGRPDNSVVGQWMVNFLTG